MANESLSPVASDAEPLDPAHFTELVSSCKVMGKDHIFAKSTSPSEGLYSVKHRLGPRSTQPEIELHRGRDGATLGVVKLHIRSQEIGLGDPDCILEEEREREQDMVWETLKRCNKWNYKEYEFEFGHARERKTYTWRRTKAVLGKMKEFELREGVKDQVNGKVIAVWKNGDKWMMRRGSLFVAKDAEGGSPSLEVLAVLSILAIIEAAIRRQ